MFPAGSTAKITIHNQNGSAFKTLLIEGMLPSQLESIISKNLIAQGIKEVYGEPARIKPGVVDRYNDLTRRPGNRRAMMDIFRVLLKVNKEELHGTSARVAQIQAPTLLLWGERDRWISPKHVPLWQRDLPGIQVKTYPGVGHIPMEEIPQQSAADALRFLQG